MREPVAIHRVRRHHGRAYRVRNSLALDSARAASLQQRIYLSHAHPAEVAGNRMLQATRSNRELERFLTRESSEHAVDQTSRETIARTDAVDDVVNLITAAG